MNGRIGNPIDCLTENLPDILAEALNLDRVTIHSFFREGRIRVSKTPDPSLGDYGYSLHSLFIKYNIPSEKWVEFGEKILSLMREKRILEKCGLTNAVFTNGYLNVSIDHGILLLNLIETIRNGTYRVNIGENRLVVVEHTSANPVHPLHIGSGRNSVLGDTFARLLEYLGFKVSRRFYVNDMGRQVATLVYGYLKLLNRGVKPKQDMKIDHWFGVVYALTNVIIEKWKLLKELDNHISNLYDTIYSTYRDLINSPMKSLDITLLQLFTNLYRVLSINKYVHNVVKFIDETRSVINDALNLIENSKIRSRFEYLKSIVEDVQNKVQSLINELNDLDRVMEKLCLIDSDACRVLSNEIKSYEEAEEGIRNIMKGMERKDPEILSIVRNVSNMVINGFNETLSRLGVFIDCFDWESDIHSKYTEFILEKIRSVRYVKDINGALIVDLDEASREHEYISKLFAPDVAGKVTLTRSDGTSLYVTRDIGYSIYKLIDIGAWKSYNVIAVEQEREQKQLKAIMYLLGYTDRVDDIVHFSYEMVNLKGYSMSGRRGEYYTVDELIDDYKKYVVKNYVENQLKLGKKVFSYNLEEYDSILEKLAVACTRSLLLSVEPGKVLIFDPSKPGEYDIGTWIIYTFVRLQSILRKALEIEPLDQVNVLIDKLFFIESNIDVKRIVLSDEEKQIIERLSSFNKVLLDAYVSAKPNIILEYTNQLCQVLNRFYEKHPVIGERDTNIMLTRLALVILSFIVLKDLIWIMGLPMVRKL